MISVRSNGTFGVEYDEAGTPKEDRIAESRLRCRHVALSDRPPTGDGSNTAPSNGASSTGSRSDNGREVFDEDETVLAEVGEGRGEGEHEEQKEAKVEEYLGDNVYRVRFVDGSGSRELEAIKLRCENAKYKSSFLVCKP